MNGWHDRREARAKFLLGKLLAETGADECAAELLVEATRRDPALVEARVELGFVLGGDEDYEGMIEAFREAIRADERAVRRTVQEEPEELAQLRRILRPDPPEPPVSDQGRPASSAAMPAEFREAGALVSLAIEYVGAGGRDGEAVDALEAALGLDPTHQYAASLLALAHLLKVKGGTPTIGPGVLREEYPDLAHLLSVT